LSLIHEITYVEDFEEKVLRKIQRLLKFTHASLHTRVAAGRAASEFHEL
jgi:hypothetical protein